MSLHLLHNVWFRWNATLRWLPLRKAIIKQYRWLPLKGNRNAIPLNMALTISISNFMKLVNANTPPRSVRPAHEHGYTSCALAWLRSHPVIVLLNRGFNGIPSDDYRSFGSVDSVVYFSCSSALRLNHSSSVPIFLVFLYIKWFSWLNYPHPVSFFSWSQVSLLDPWSY